METNNLTIIIPIRIDSDVRLRNLTAVVMYYKRLKLPLLLIEADECSRIDFDKSYTQVRHIFISDSNPIFHRTKYINLGLRSITTPHAAIIDADVIVPSYQLKQANQLLNHTPMILPYDGRFIHMPHSLGDIFRNTASFKDIQTHYESNKTDYMFGYHSVGGAYLVNVDLYRQCGWENEYFTGWGPEDFERVQRMDILGFPVTRIRGVIYHLDHPRGINSGNSPYDLAFSTRKEYCKVCNMTANELRTYIHTWPWTSRENIKHLCKMGIVSMSNKRRRTPLIDNNFILNVIYTTLLTVKYNKKAYARLKKENETTSSGIICKRYRVLMAKMSEPKLSSGRIAAITGCSRNFVDNCRSLFFCHG